ncbi:unnamed protein product [Dibothriocephalus latus]|uniref:OB domain-containing protein n=1 Tax=Dibothriocephalus latus TaxID=60516 RepID=A0A3P7LU87_DIBLA|nr:unnamed protein product [Dibothriocephalus latus]
MSTANLKAGSPTRTKDGNEVRTVKVADRTGCINLSVWNEKGALIAPCDTLQLLQGVEMKAKCKRRSGQPEKPTNLPDLLEYLTTRGKQDLDPALLRDLKQLLVSVSCYSASAEAIEEAHRLLFLHMQRPHAEIRLGSLTILDILSSPDAIGEADIPSSTASRVAFKFRELTIMQLQVCNTLGPCRLLLFLLLLLPPPPPPPSSSSSSSSSPSCILSFLSFYLYLLDCLYMFALSDLIPETVFFCGCRVDF